jgi:hypothetical protein
MLVTAAMPERQRAHGHQREGGGAAQAAQRVPKVLP